MLLDVVVDQRIINVIGSTQGTVELGSIDRFEQVDLWANKWRYLLPWLLGCNWIELAELAGACRQVLGHWRQQNKVMVPDEGRELWWVRYPPNGAGGVVHRPPQRVGQDQGALLHTYFQWVVGLAADPGGQRHLAYSSLPTIASSIVDPRWFGWRSRPSFSFL